MDLRLLRLMHSFDCHCLISPKKIRPDTLILNANGSAECIESGSLLSQQKQRPIVGTVAHFNILI